MLSQTLILIENVMEKNRNDHLLMILVFEFEFFGGTDSLFNQGLFSRLWHGFKCGKFV